MATKNSLPLVDFESVLFSNNLAACPQVQEIHDAFTEVGFVFITNHGIDQELVSLKDRFVKSCSVNYI